MQTLIQAALRAVRSLFTPGMFGIFLLSVALTIAALIGFIALVSSVSIWLSGEVANSDLAAALPWIGTVGSTLLAWFLFPGIMPIIVNFFDDRIARLIEDHDYAAIRPAQEPPFWPELWHDLRFSALAIFLNVLVLPLYLVPVINLFLFYLLNGYLLGREFFVMVARRHILMPDADRMRKRYSRTVFIAGIALALLATMPILNLFAPFWGIAMMTHLYHQLAGTRASHILPANR